MKTCFSIMPFGDVFDEIDGIIEAAAQDCGLEYVRGDRLLRPGSILPQILRQIQHASVIVADITGNNPNVFYELGVAHQVRGTERVIILTADKTSPYDVHEFRQLVYTNNRAGWERLRHELPLRIREAADSAEREVWSVVRGRLPRTKLIVRDLQRVLEHGEGRHPKDVTIRIVAGMGSLAISDREPSEPGIEPEYAEALIEERNVLRDLLARGARLKAVLNPPRRFARGMLPTRLRVRYERLIGLLEGQSDLTDPDAASADLKAIQRCCFAISPIPMQNVFIIGDHVAYEGMKRGGAGGFEMTHCETHPDGVGELIRKFDQLFDDSLHDMCRSHPPDGALLRQLKSFYEEAIATEPGAGV